MLIRLIIITAILVFGSSSVIAKNEDVYDFDFIARENAFNLFEDVEEEANKTQKYQHKKDSHIELKWAEKPKEKKESITVIFGDDQDHNTTGETTNEKYAYVEWFNKAHKPEVLKNRQLKTQFRNNDPFYGKHLCNNGEFTCIKLKKNDSWKSLFPNKYHRELVQRLNRTNKGLWNRNWILVPNDVNRDYMDFAPLPYYWDTNNKKTIVIDLSELAFGAYGKDGELVHWGPVNPGKNSSRTVRGENFKVYRKGGSECWSKKYESKIPYCMFFHKGFAIHGYTMPGYPASHGCVRAYNDDALWLNKNFADYKTRVIVQE